MELRNGIGLRPLGNTPTEFERKREQLPAVKLAAEQGLELLPEPTG